MTLKALRPGNLYGMARICRAGLLALCLAASDLSLEAKRGTEPMSPAQRFSMPITETDDAWNSKGANLYDTTEARRVVRIGDIDNFGFGWQIGASPYHGMKLRERPALWLNPELSENGYVEDPAGTDLLMARSGSIETRSNDPGDLTHYAVETQIIEAEFPSAEDTEGSVLLQLYIAGFDSPHSDEKYVATLNGESAPFLENALNAITVADGGGALLTLALPEEMSEAVRQGTFSLKIDKTGPLQTEQDIFAIDFVRILFEPDMEGGGDARLRGRLLPVRGGDDVAGTDVSFQGKTTQLDAEGRFIFKGVYGGLGILEVAHSDGSGLHTPISIHSMAPTKNVTLRLKDDF